MYANRPSNPHRFKFAPCQIEKSSSLPFRERRRSQNASIADLAWKHFLNLPWIYRINLWGGSCVLLLEHSSDSSGKIRIFFSFVLSFPDRAGAKLLTPNGWSTWMGRPGPRTSIQATSAFERRSSRGINLLLWEVWAPESRDVLGLQRENAAGLHVDRSGALAAARSRPRHPAAARTPCPSGKVHEDRSAPNVLSRPFRCLDERKWLPIDEGSHYNEWQWNERAREERGRRRRRRKKGLQRVVRVRRPAPPYVSYPSVCLQYRLPKSGELPPPSRSRWTFRLLLSSLNYVSRLRTREALMCTERRSLSIYLTALTGTAQSGCLVDFWYHSYDELTHFHVVISDYRSVSNVPIL